VLFGAAHQLDAWLRGLHQAAIDGEIIERHAVCGEAGLELFSDRMSAQPGQTIDGADRAGSSSTMKPVKPSSMISGTEPRLYAITGVPHAIASIMTRPNGSGQSIGTSSPIAR